mmetsp:Transcript_23153/g.26617  ORF Transcript_23153/g.26617 Transcript_23153/m.26617 type:complete len:114 (-) Transcript_23153:161-502(-)
MTNPSLPDDTSMSTSTTNNNHWLSDSLLGRSSEWRIVCLHATVGHGTQVYEALKDAVLGWELHLPSSNPIHPAPELQFGGLPRIAVQYPADWGGGWEAVGHVCQIAGPAVVGD